MAFLKFGCRCTHFLDFSEKLSDGIFDEECNLDPNYKTLVRKGNSYLEVKLLYTLFIPSTVTLLDILTM